MVFLSLLISFCVFLVFLSDSLLKMICFMLVALVGTWSFLDGWMNYFFLLTYLGGFFILLFYMAVLSFSREVSSLCGLLFFGVGGPTVKMKSSFLACMWVPSLGFGCVCLILGCLLLGMFILSLILPSGSSVQGKI